MVNFSLPTILFLIDKHIKAMQTKAFFGKEGLTSTSANHYANLAKEVNRNNQNYLANVRFYSESIAIIGDADKGGVIREGTPTSELNAIANTIICVGQLNSLIAFFREAIKEKERLTIEVANWEDAEAHKQYLEREAALKAAKPTLQPYITEEPVKESWSIGEQEKYLSLEAEAAAIGKYIHEDGCISQARIDLMKRTSNPKSVNENGRDTIIHSYTPTADFAEVDKMFFNLQNRHREVQAELNGMKKRIKDAIEADKVEKNEQYRLAYQKWNAEMNALSREFTEILNVESAKRQQLSQEVQALKIVVPNRLKDVFEALQK